MKIINLYSLKQPAIIVKAQTGLVYSNQTDGVACSHPQQEGFLVLLAPAPGSRVFDPRWWYNGVQVLNNELFDEIETLLNGKYRFEWHIRDVRVDRSAHNQEAWIHVKFRGDFESRVMAGGTFCTDMNADPKPENYPEYEGILTWENCD